MPTFLVVSVVLTNLLTVAVLLWVSWLMLRGIETIRQLELARLASHAADRAEDRADAQTTESVRVKERAENRADLIPPPVLDGATPPPLLGDGGHRHGSKA